MPDQCKMCLDEGSVPHPLSTCTTCALFICEHHTLEWDGGDYCQDDWMSLIHTKVSDLQSFANTEATGQPPSYTDAATATEFAESWGKIEEAAKLLQALLDNIERLSIIVGSG